MNWDAREWRARYFGMLKDRLNNLQVLTSYQLQAPIYSLSFSHLDSRWLLVSDESGLVSILDTEEAPLGPKDQFRAHNNSIFDSGWSLDGCKVMTASGDLSAAVWDIETKHAVVLNGHLGSVKCIRNSPIWRDVYISAARDDRILIWDLREGGRGSSVSPIGYISEELVKPVAGNRGKRGMQSYTAVELVCGGHVAVSCDAHEAGLKFWDLRKMIGANPSKNKAKARPRFAGSLDPLSSRRVQQAALLEQEKLSAQLFVPPTARDTYRLEDPIEPRLSGSASLALSPSKNQLLVTSLSNCLYVYPSINHVDTIPPLQLMGLKVSFYVRSQFSPDERFIVSGSQDGSIHIWDLEDLTWQAVLSNAHSQEVNSVSWTDTHSAFLASCSDDREVKLWDCV